MSINARLKAAVDAAAFTVTDAACWWQCSRGAMNLWLTGTPPHQAKERVIVPLIEVLEKATKHWPSKLPIPLSVKQYDRRKYVEELRDAAVSAFSKESAAGARGEVLDKHPQ